MTNEPEFPEELPHRSEMMEVVMTVVATLNDVITALRGEVTALAVNEQQGRRRLTMYLVMLGLVGLASVAGISLNYNQDCQDPDGDCKQRSNAALAGAVASISGAVFDATACMQKLPLAERTDEQIKACRDQFIGAPRK
jgi:hypothetical protein